MKNTGAPSLMNTRRVRKPACMQEKSSWSALKLCATYEVLQLLLCAESISKGNVTPFKLSTYKIVNVLKACVLCTQHVLKKKAEHY